MKHKALAQKCLVPDISAWEKLQIVQNTSVKPAKPGGRKFAARVFSPSLVLLVILFPLVLVLLFFFVASFSMLFSQVFPCLFERNLSLLGICSFFQWA